MTKGNQKPNAMNKSKTRQISTSSTTITATTTSSATPAPIHEVPEVPTHNLYNLTLLDPPKYGWCASGGIIQLLEPHEKARRKSTREDFLFKQTQNEFFIKQRKKEREEKKRRKLLAQQQEQGNVQVQVDQKQDQDKAVGGLDKKSQRVSGGDGDADGGVEESIGTSGEMPMNVDEAIQNANEIDKGVNPVLPHANENRPEENDGTKMKQTSNTSNTSSNESNDSNKEQQDQGQRALPNKNKPYKGDEKTTTESNAEMTDSKKEKSNKATMNKTMHESQGLNSTNTSNATSTSIPLNESLSQPNPEKPMTTTSISTSTIRTRNQGQKTPSTSGIKKRKKKRKIELEYSALMYVNEIVHLPTNENVQDTSDGKERDGNENDIEIDSSGTIPKNTDAITVTNTVTDIGTDAVVDTKEQKKKECKERTITVEAEDKEKRVAKMEVEAEAEAEAETERTVLTEADSSKSENKIEKKDETIKSQETNQNEQDILRKENKEDTGTSNNDNESEEVEMGTKTLGAETQPVVKKESDISKNDVQMKSANEDVVNDANLNQQQSTNITETKMDENKNSNNNDDNLTTGTTSNVATSTSNSTNTKVVRKIKLDPLIYHRGAEGKEERDKQTGVLLCPTEATDTNYDWDEPNLTLTVNVCFPLVDTDELILGDGGDHNDDHFNDIGSSDERMMNTVQDDLLSPSTPLPVRRNKRRGNQNKAMKKHESILERRLKREAKIKELPHFQAEVQWNLSNPNYRTPLVYASDIAVEYGLSLNQTLDLARSIQEQIDDHVRTNVKYKIPISSVDPLSNQRGDGTLQPPEYYLPKVLYGGHGASNIVPGKKGSLLKVSDDESDSESENEKQQATKATSNNKNALGRNKAKNSTNKNRSSNAGTSGGRRSFGSGTVSKYTRKNHELCPKDQLPTHDPSKFYVDHVYVQEVLLRLRKASETRVKALVGQVGENGEPLGETYIIKNHNCHICHTRKPECVIFPCGNSRHAYCDLHCTTRLGFRALEHKQENLCYCPICSLQCICSKCTKGVAGLASTFKKECDRQKLGLKETIIDDIFALKDGSQPGSTRPKSVVKPKPKTNNKRSKPVKHSPPKVAKRAKVSKAVALPSSPKSSKPLAVPLQEAKITVAKVPPCEFPSEIGDAINLDPSLEDDYRTVFTPEGSFVRESSLLELEEPSQPEEPESVDIEDGNVDYCLICKKSGGLLCCDKCPRAFHHTCLDVNKSDLPDQWECPRCTIDSTEQNEDTVSGFELFEKLALVFKSYEQTKGGEDIFFKKINVLNKIQDVIQRLLDYDFGYVFAAPVSVREVPDYRQIVKRPMDLGTIKANISKGAYNNKFPHDLKSDSSQCTPLELIILEILKDIELVWHNCLLYNREGTSYYRMAKVMSQKYIVMRQINIDEGLSEYIRQQLGIYVAECKQSRLERANQLVQTKISRIPISKHQFQVSAAKRGVKKAVAVFDQSTNMVVKQYTSMASAGQAAMLLKKLGFECEINPVTQNSVKSIISKSATDPSLLIFGYRWIRVEDLRSGQFVVDESEKRRPIIQKVCSISNAKLAGFDTIEKAYQDWIDYRKACLSLPSSGRGEESIEYFIEKFLDGNEMIDGVWWERIKEGDKDKSSNNMMTRQPLIKMESEANVDG